MELERDEDSGRRRPAPGGLKLVQGFVNSNDIEEGKDQIRTPELLRAWLVQRGLIESDEKVTEADLSRSLELREALRALLLANGGSSLDPRSIETLNRVAERARLGVRFESGGQAALEAAERGVDGALARILGAVFTSMAEGTWDRLKACRSDACVWAFYDYSKNRSGAWCRMEVCGNRTKVRAYQSRRRAGAR